VIPVDSSTFPPYIRGGKEKIMAMSQVKIREYLIQAFPDAVIEIKDLAGDNDHFAATITSQAFQGKTRIAQHKMVYDALQGHMGTRLHALSLKTQVPAE
jgi:stress-induced morphogen